MGEFELGEDVDQGGVVGSKEVRRVTMTNDHFSRAAQRGGDGEQFRAVLENGDSMLRNGLDKSRSPLEEELPLEKKRCRSSG